MGVKLEEKGLITNQQSELFFKNEKGKGCNLTWEAKTVSRASEGFY